MTCHLGKVTTWLVAVAMTVGCVSAASAQVFTGRVEVTVEDSTGGRLPGVNVDLTGPINQTQVTDAQGQAHFLNLAVGTYTVKAVAPGFNTTRTTPSSRHRRGDAALGEARRRRHGGDGERDGAGAGPRQQEDTTSTNITQEELQEVPSSRDPWVVLQTVPGVVTDRVNVGGAESGQQSGYVAKGASGGDNTWNMDGVAITDMAAPGSSPTYYDFDMFQEMNVTTGGADVQAATPRRADEHGAKSAATRRAAPRASTSRTRACRRQHLAGARRRDRQHGRQGQPDRPVPRQRLRSRRADPEGPRWAWGAIGKTDVRLLTLANDADKTMLKNYSFKGDGKMTTPSAATSRITRRQAEVRPQRGADASAGNDVGPGRADAGVQG